MTTIFPSIELVFSDTASQPDEQVVSIPKTSTAAQSSNTSNQPIPSPTGQQMATPELLSEKNENNGMDARTKISSLLKDKEQEWTAVVNRKGPLRLLDLPMDVLKEIVKEAGT